MSQCLELYKRGALKQGDFTVPSTDTSREIIASQFAVKVLGTTLYGVGTRTTASFFAVSVRH